MSFESYLFAIHLLKLEITDNIILPCKFKTHQTDIFWIVSAFLSNTICFISLFVMLCLISVMHIKCILQQFHRNRRRYSYNKWGQSTEDFSPKRVQPSNSYWTEAPFGGVRDVSIIIYFFFVVIFSEQFLLCGLTIHIYIYCFFSATWRKHIMNEWYKHVRI